MNPSRPGGGGAPGGSGGGPAGADLTASAPVGPVDDGFVRDLVEVDGPALRGYVRRLLGGDRDTADDVVQETLLRAWQHRDVLVPAGRRSWLLHVARNLVRDHYRRVAARPPEASFGHHAPADPRGVRELDLVLDRQVLVDLVARLSDPHRQAVLHRHYADLTEAETAHRLGVPVGTVKSRAHYALGVLRAQLAGSRGPSSTGGGRTGSGAGLGA